jgi:hypothetical protein
MEEVSRRGWGVGRGGGMKRKQKRCCLHVTLEGKTAADGALIYGFGFSSGMNREKKRCCFHVILEGKTAALILLVFDK